MLNPNLVFQECCVHKLCTMSWHIFLCTMSRHLSATGQIRRCGFLAFYLDNHTERGAGGRQYGKSEKDKQTLTGQNNTSSA
jgi:hypothetical protein